MIKNNNINDAIKKMRYRIYKNGKEVKKYAFYRQAKQCLLNHTQDTLFNDGYYELIDTETGEIITK